jgi:hypothetical protein
MLNNFWREVKDIFWIVKNCLTTFWFWLPVLFYILLCFELYLIACVNPLLALVVPSVIVAYALTDEKRRLKLQYGLNSLKEEPYTLKIRNGLESFHWKIEKSVKEYEELIKKEKERKIKRSKVDE